MRKGLVEILRYFYEGGRSKWAAKNASAANSSMEIGGILDPRLLGKESTWQRNVSHFNMKDTTLLLSDLQLLFYT